MKFHPLGLVLCLALASCGESDEKSAPTAPLPGAQREPVKRTTATVTATKEIQDIALQRLALMQKITEVLKPIRDQAAAEAKEAELERLFAQYSGLSQKAAELGMKDIPLAALTDHLAPDDSKDARTEFFMYLGIVRQIGEEQSEMLDRIMGVADRAPVEAPEEP
ncbi:MAG: hypothetical protein ACR2RV_08565 [Verrucomicrobiales bacterium]